MPSGDEGPSAVDRLANVLHSILAPFPNGLDFDEVLGASHYAKAFNLFLQIFSVDNVFDNNTSRLLSKISPDQLYMEKMLGADLPETFHEAYSCDGLKSSKFFRVKDKTFAIKEGKLTFKMDLHVKYEAPLGDSSAGTWSHLIIPGEYSMPLDLSVQGQARIKVPLDYHLGDVVDLKTTPIEGYDAAGEKWTENANARQLTKDVKLLLEEKIHPYMQMYRAMKAHEQDARLAGLVTDTLTVRKRMGFNNLRDKSLLKAAGESGHASDDLQQKAVYRILRAADAALTKHFIGRQALSDDEKEALRKGERIRTRIYDEHGYGTAARPFTFDRGTGYRAISDNMLVSRKDVSYAIEETVSPIPRARASVNKGEGVSAVFGGQKDGPHVGS